MLKIKDLKSKQRIWHERHGADEIYTVWGSPFEMLLTGEWAVETKNEGGFCWVFYEVDQEQLHLELEEQ